MRARRTAPLSGAWVRAIAALLALTVVPVGLRGQAAADREVVELTFSGNRAFDDGTLAGAISTRETRCRSFLFKVPPLAFCPLTDWGFAHDRSYLNEAELPTDVVRLRVFYRRRGYRDVRVDTVVHRTDEDVRIRFEIEEGQPTRVSRLEFEGLAGILDPEEVRRDVPLEAGDPFDLVALGRGKQAIADRLRNRGYIDAAVLDEYFLPSGTREAEVTVRVRPGPRTRIGEIRIRGAGDLGESVVRQRLTFSSGEYYRQDRILSSQRELYGLEAIRFADVSTAGVSGTDTLVYVNVDVTPARKRAVRAGLGFTTTECLQTEASFTHRNFLGGARRLRLSGQLSNLLARQLGGGFPCSQVSEQDVFQDVGFSLRADFRQPTLFSGRNSLQAGLFLERQTIPDLFVRDSRGGELSLTRRLAPRMTLTLTTRPELTSFEQEPSGVFFCVNFGFCQPEDIDVVTEARWLSPLILSWSLDRTDSPLSPTSGYYVNLSLEGADALTGSDYRYVRFNVDAAAFEELAPGLVLAARFRAGFVEPSVDQPFGRVSGQEEPVVHPRKRFFAGGAQSIRGFGQNLLGPSVALLDAGRCAGGSDTRSALVACADSLAALQNPPPFSDATPLNPTDVFDERPVGGNAAFEANLELRARLSRNWSLVGFVDAGQVWRELSEPTAPVATPGLGLRYASPIGPLRVDVGYDPSSPQLLPVVAQTTTAQGGEIVDLEHQIRFERHTYGEPETPTEIWRRLQLHISVGQAF